MDIKCKATEALEKGNYIAGNVADKAKILGMTHLKTEEVGGQAVDKIKEVAGEVTKEGSFLDKLKAKAETLTGIGLNRDGKLELSQKSS